MKRGALLFLTIGLMTISCDRSKEKPEATATTAEAPETATQPGGEDDKPAREGPNAAQREMQLLTEAMQANLTLIANDQLDGIPAQIKKVHPARQATVKAIEAGEYAPPRNSDDIAGFKAMDDAFHEDLKTLLKASKEDNLKGATDAYARLVSGCTECHQKYRFEPPEEPEQ